MSVSLSTRTLGATTAATVNPTSATQSLSTTQPNDTIAFKGKSTQDQQTGLFKTKKLEDKAFEKAKRLIFLDYKWHDLNGKGKAWLIVRQICLMAEIFLSVVGTVGGISYLIDRHEAKKNSF